MTLVSKVCDARFVIVLKITMGPPSVVVFAAPVSVKLGNVVTPDPPRVYVPLEVSVGVLRDTTVPLLSKLPVRLIWLLISNSPPTAIVMLPFTVIVEPETTDKVP